MKNYNIEGGIDFYNELYKSLDVDENEYKTENDNNLCLITNMQLIEHFVKMDCGHQFNYIPLYNDIKNHKSKFNGMEGSNGHLNIDEIRCPYCRKKQKGVLPYYENLGLDKINGVNIINPSQLSHNIYKFQLCEFLTPNTNFDPSGNDPIETSTTYMHNCKFVSCHYSGHKSNIFSNYYNYIINNNLNIDKYYCYMHMKYIIKTHKKEQTEKAKEEAKLLKIKEKQEIKKAKEEEKQKIKEEKQKIKEELKKSVMLAKANKKSNISDATNTVVGITNIPIVNTDMKCGVILKTGPNKGNICGCKVVENNLCKRHIKST
jgi:hypothetical protein